MKKIMQYLLFLSFSIGICQNQLIKTTEINSLLLEANVFLGYDQFKAHYYIKNNVLSKKNSDQIWQYKNPPLGKIAKVDFQNPLKIILFYENFNTVVILDNQLNETQKINLSDNRISIVASAVGLAFGNRLWIYNSLTQQVGLLDYMKNEYLPITTPISGNVVYYESDFNYLHWIDNQSMLYYCDVFGKVFQKGIIPKYDQFQVVSDKAILYSKDNQLYYFNYQEKSTSNIEIDKKTFKSFIYKDQILSIFTNQGITNYKITIP